MFYDIFKQLCEQKGVSVYRAAKDMEFSNSTTTKWKKTGATPDGDTIAAVAKYFDVTSDFLLGIEKAPTPKSEGEEFEEAMKVALFGGSGEVTPEMWEEVKQFARMVMLRVESDKKNGRNA